MWSERACSGRLGLGLGLQKLKPHILMVLFQFNFAGLQIMSMVCLKKGMSHYVLPVYRHAVATLALVPFALILERKTRPKMSLPTFLRIMLLGFVEPVLDQNIYYVGMKYTSATYAAAMANLIPAFTFLLAFILRLERVDVKKIHSLAKVIGTLISITGAMLMALYKGPVMDLIKSRGVQTHHPTAANASTTHASAVQWITGTLLLLASVFGYAGFTILQTTTLRKYPANLSLTALICLMGTVEGAAVALVMQPDMAAWRLGWDSRLLGVAYSGVLSSGIGYYVQGVVCSDRGPVFVTSFYPLGMIITAALGTVILAEQLFLGSIIGAIIIAVGLYTFVWGKSNDDSPPTSSEPAAAEAAAATTTTLATTELIMKSNDPYELPVTNTKSAMSKVTDNAINSLPITQTTVK